MSDVVSQVLERLERQLASLERVNVSRTGKMGVTSQGHGACVSVTARDLRVVLDTARTVFIQPKE